MARPRKFDEMAVLDAATDIFWSKGYEATSTRDLALETGLTLSSIYSAFGDKQGLFKASLSHYLVRLRNKISFLETSVDPEYAITYFFYDVFSRSLLDKTRKGCFLVNSSIEATPCDEELRIAIENEFVLIKDFFYRCFRKAQNHGVVSETYSPENVAQLLFTVLLGIRVLTRAYPEEELMRGAINQALKGFDLPILPS